MAGVGKTMPQSERRGYSTRTAILLAIAAWLAGCAAVGETKPEAAAASVTAEALPGPVALAPELTEPSEPAAKSAATTVAAVRAGPAPVASAEPTAAAIAAVLGGPAPMAAPEPAPAAAPSPAPVAMATFAPAPATCPSDTVGAWSGPDAAGVPVFVCRRLNPR